jgi:hypothetical protein
MNYRVANDCERFTFITIQLRTNVVYQRIFFFCRKMNDCEGFCRLRYQVYIFLFM